ncbi:MAG TPA: PEP-CTERM sorting domain-containing protein [Terracidiphilus sp.]|nr:PEP-CTERM sorting domain-containing protein [Terracidiphilus sp.]
MQSERTILIALTSPGGGGDYVDDAACTTAPEPGSLFLLGTGMLALAFMFRRRLLV